MITMNKAGEIRATAPALNSIKNRNANLPKVYGQSYKETGDSIKISAQGAYQAKLDLIRQKGMETINRQPSLDRIEQLKKEYAGERCPVSGCEIAKAMLEGFAGKEAL